MRRHHHPLSLPSVPRDLVTDLLAGDVREGDYSAQERAHMRADDPDGTFAWHLRDDQLTAALRRPLPPYRRRS